MELKARTARSIADEEEMLELGADCPIEPAQVYLKEDVDEAIAELKEENLNLKAKNIKLQSFYDLHGNVDNYIENLKSQFVPLYEELKRVKDENENLKNNLFVVETDIAMATRWRKVSEELPEVEEDCGEIFLVAVAVETEKKTKGSYVTSAEFCNGEWYNDSTGNEIEENIEREDCFYRSKITHWMPMPNAPKED